MMYALSYHSKNWAKRTVQKLKGLLLTFLLLLEGVLGAYAQDPQLVHVTFPEQGNFVPSGHPTLFRTWESTGTPKVTVESWNVRANGTETHARNMVDNKDGTIGIAPGNTNHSRLKFKLPPGYLFGSFTIKGEQRNLTGDQSFTITINGESFNVNSTNRTNVTHTYYNINAQEFYMELTGANAYGGSINLRSVASVDAGEAVGVYYRVHTQDGKRYLLGPFPRPKGDAVSAEGIPNEVKRGYCTYRLHASNTTTRYAQDAIVDLDCQTTGELPFAFSTADSPAWHLLETNTKMDAYRPYYAHFANPSSSVSADYPKQPITQGYEWAFIGNPYEMRVVNRERGTNYYLSVSRLDYNGTTGYSSDIHDKVTYALYKDTLASYAGFSLEAISVNAAGTTYATLPATATADAYTVGSTNVWIAASGLDPAAGVNGEGNNPALLCYKHDCPRYGGTVDASGNGVKVLNAHPIRDIYYTVYDHADNLVEKTPVYRVAAGTKPELPAQYKRGFCKYTYGGLDAIAPTTTEVRVDYSVDWKNFPFNISDDVNDLQYYLLTAGKANSEEPIFYPQGNQGAEGSIDITPKQLNAFLASGNSSNADADSHFFAFTGDPYTLRVYNKAAGPGKPLSLTAADLAAAQAAGDDTPAAAPKFQAGEYAVWDLFKDDFDNGKYPGGFALRLKGAQRDAANHPELRDTTRLWTVSDGSELLVMSSAQQPEWNDTYGMGTSVELDEPAASMLQVYIYKKGTYVVTRLNGTTVDTYPDQNFVVGASPYLARRYRSNFCNYYYFSTPAMGSNDKLEKVQEGTDIIYVREQSGELPFELSDPIVGVWKWYYLETGGKLVSAVGPGPYLAFDKASAYGSPLMLWAFVGDPATGFKIYNRAHEGTFTLSNPYSSYVHSATAGPFLAREGDNPTLWRLIDHSGMSYGWQDMKTRDWAEPMNISIYVDTPFGIPALTYFKDDADHSSFSRFRFIPFGTETIEGDASTMVLHPTQTGIPADAEQTYVQPLVDRAGTVFAFTPEAAQRYGTLSDGREKLKLVSDIRNYVTMTYPRNFRGTIRNAQTGTLLQCAPSNYVSTNDSIIPTVENFDRASARWFIEQDNSAGTARYKMRSQKHYLDRWGTAMRPVDKAADERVGIFPMYQARAVIVGETNPTRKPATKALAPTLGTAENLEGQRPVKPGNYITTMASQWYLEPNTSITLNTTKVTGANDYYYNKVYGLASVVYDFPVRFDDANAVPHYVSAYETNGVYVARLTPYPNREVPATQPFILVTKTADANTTATILDHNPAFTGRNLLGGSYLKTTFGTGTLEHKYENTRILAYRKSEASYVYIDNDGHKSGIVFLKAPTSYQDASSGKGVGPNMAFLDLASITQAGAKALVFTMNFDDLTTLGITDLQTDGTANADRAPWYDLQGRRVQQPARGVYIRGGRKVVVR